MRDGATEGLCDENYMEVNVSSLVRTDMWIDYPFLSRFHHVVVMPGMGRGTSPSPTPSATVTMGRSSTPSNGGGGRVLPLQQMPSRPPVERARVLG